MSSTRAIGLNQILNRRIAPSVNVCRLDNPAPQQRKAAIGTRLTNQRVRELKDDYFLSQLRLAQRQGLLEELLQRAGVLGSLSQCGTERIGGHPSW